MGNIKNDNIHGKGVIVLANGDICSGTWLNGQMHGTFWFSYQGPQEDEVIYYENDMVVKTQDFADAETEVSYSED